VNLDSATTKILVVDDDPVMRDLLQRILGHEGYEVSLASDAMQALDSINGDSWIRAVVTDIRMPGMDGKDLMTEILALWSETVVILMTAYGGAMEYLETTKSGAAEYLLKPLNTEELLRVLENRVGKPGFLPSDYWVT
jgi:DNA-binding NtrC family response regulator